MEPMSDYAQLQLHFVDTVQRRYEVIRPIVLMGDRTAAQRAEETHLHPETVRDLTRRFRQQGMGGLFPEHTDIVTPSRGRAVPEVVVEELARLKALYDGLGYRELARIILHQTHERLDDKTVKQLWQQSPRPCKVNCPCPPTTAIHSATRAALRSSNAIIKSGRSAASVAFCTSRVRRSTLDWPL